MNTVRYGYSSCDRIKFRVFSNFIIWRWGMDPTLEDVGLFFCCYFNKALVSREVGDISGTH